MLYTFWTGQTLNLTLKEGKNGSLGDRPDSAECWTVDEFLAWCARAARGEVWLTQIRNTQGPNKPLWTVDLCWEERAANAVADIGLAVMARRGWTLEQLAERRGCSVEEAEWRLERQQLHETKGTQ